MPARAPCDEGAPFAFHRGRRIQRRKPRQGGGDDGAPSACLRGCPVMKARLVLAGANPGKLAEYRALLADLPAELLGLDAFPGLTLPEEGGDYQCNARQKALTVCEAVGLPALGDDSGLEVAALSGAPGPFSARYGGPGLSDNERLQRLLAELGDAQDRRARFVCCIALALPTGAVHVKRALCPGRILSAPRGEGGFGYDPVFQPEGFDGSMAELSAAQKNRISHRALAVQALKDELRAAFPPIGPAGAAISTSGKAGAAGAAPGPAA